MLGFILLNINRLTYIYLRLPTFVQSRINLHFPWFQYVNANVENISGKCNCRLLFFRAVAKANFGKKILKINIDSEQCYFNLGPFVWMKNESGTAFSFRPALWWNLHFRPFLRSFDVGSDFLVKFLSLLFEPRGVCCVCCELDPARPDGLAIVFPFRQSLSCGNRLSMRTDVFNSCCASCLRLATSFSYPVCIV